MRSECAFHSYGNVTAMMSHVIRETKDSFRLSTCPLTGYVGGPRCRRGCKCLKMQTAVKTPEACGSDEPRVRQSLSSWM